MHQVSNITASQDLHASITTAVDEIGGFGSIIAQGDVVLIKPNFNTADPFPASTDPAFLRAVVELTYAHGAKSVIVGESSTFTRNTKKIMEHKGIMELLNMETPPRVVSFDEGTWVQRTIPNGKHLKSVHVPELLDRVDKVILVPCLKTHFQAQYTGALKLSVGFMRPAERVPLHMSRIQEKIAELNTVIPMHLAIMDARKCFITGGPAKGTEREPGRILASKDRVAMDIEGMRIIQGFEGNALKGIDPLTLPQIRHALELGVDGATKEPLA